jgi:2-hydroxy-3-oxopropionate reductase
MTQLLGFVGVGLMGKHMATNLLKGGYKLVIHDANRIPVKELAGLGAKEGDLPKGSLRYWGRSGGWKDV